MNMKEDKPFLTRQVTEIDSTIPQADTINTLFGQITNCIGDLDGKVGRVLQKHEADFLNVYKGHMYNIQKEMRLLKEKVSDDELKRKRDEELKTLEKERDWFRNEALRLDKICKEYKRNLEIWKNKAQILEEDRKFMEHQILQVKKQNLHLKEGMESQRELNFSGEKSWIRPEEMSRASMPKLALEEKPSSQYFSTIKHLQNQIDIQKKSIHMQKAVHANYFLEKGQLEDFFIDCIEEVKKDIEKRKSSSRISSATTAKSLGKTVQDVSLSDFTGVDKRKVIEMIVGKDDVLRSLKELIFPRNYESRTRPNTGRSYGLTHVFSTPGLGEGRNVVRPNTAPKGWTKT